ncbi:MAG: DUF1801 domain-containing protein [Chitinophagaceae bacterium]|nr:DUF1801 domain-containing protein [Chitinophagaceae bacterium]
MLSVYLRASVLENLPKGFKEEMSYGMLGYVVPLDIYPDGYHCDPKLPLPFVNIASQKKFIALYHMGLYANPDLLKWFSDAYSKHSTGKLDIGKSCIRFKKPEHIPYELIGTLMKKMPVKEWIRLYEENMKRQV